MTTYSHPLIPFRCRSLGLAHVLILRKINLLQAIVPDDRDGRLIESMVLVMEVKDTRKKPGTFA